VVPRTVSPAAEGRMPPGPGPARRLLTALTALGLGGASGGPNGRGAGLPDEGERVEGRASRCKQESDDSAHAAGGFRLCRRRGPGRLRWVSGGSVRTDPEGSNGSGARRDCLRGKSSRRARRLRSPRPRRRWVCVLANPRSRDKSGAAWLLVAVRGAGRTPAPSSTTATWPCWGRRTGRPGPGSRDRCSSPRTGCAGDGANVGYGLIGAVFWARTGLPRVGLGKAPGRGRKCRALAGRAGKRPLFSCRARLGKEARRRPRHAHCAA
jgi:hypothetical protein